MSALKYHDIANIFPLIEGHAFDELTADIAENGLREKIVILDDKILDGRNRARAAIAAGLIDPHVDWRASDAFVDFRATYTGQDPLKWVLSTNLHRRHLSESQRAMVAARLEGLSHGGSRRAKKATIDGDQDANLQLDRASAAETMNISPRSVANGAKVVAATPELGEAVDAGRLSVSRAAEIAKMPKDDQRRIVESVDPSVISNLIKEQRADKTARKKQARADREKRMGTAQLSLPGLKFGAIYVDPEWRFLTRSEKGMDRSADNQYPTSKLEEIMRRDVAGIAAPDCVLFMWATVPMMMEAICVLDAWGFTSLTRDPKSGFLQIDRSQGKYVSHAVWLKETADGELANGTGYWLINEHEVLIIARRGNVVAPAMGTQYRSVLRTKRGDHSVKPDEAAEMIEHYYPTIPKIELNRRGLPRPGWWAWGNEVAGDEALGIAVDDNGFADASHMPLGAPISSTGECTNDQGEQHVRPADSDQHASPPISGSDPSGKEHGGSGGRQWGGADAGSERSANEQRDRTGSDEARGSRDVGGEGRHQIEGTSAQQDYAALLASQADKKGQYCKADVVEALTLGRKAGRTPKELAADLGHPIGSIKTWLNRHGLTDSTSRRRSQAEIAARDGVAQ